MKKLLLIITCLLAFNVNAQIQEQLLEGGLKTPLLYFGSKTTTERDALTVSATDRVILWNSTTNTVQKWNGTAWSDIGGSDYSEWASFTGTRSGNNLRVVIGEAIGSSTNASSLILDETSGLEGLITIQQGSSTKLELFGSPSTAVLTAANGLNVEGNKISLTGATGSIQFETTGITGNRSYTFKDTSGTLALTEDFTEIATYAATSTATTTLDCGTFDSRYQILTVNTNIIWTGLPAVGETFVRTLEVVGAFSLTFSTADKVIGTYVDDGTTVNVITILFSNYPTIGQRITVMINQ